jgi:hypothetical protein
VTCWGADFAADPAARDRVRTWNVPAREVVAAPETGCASCEGEASARRILAAGMERRLRRATAEGKAHRCALSAEGGVSCWGEYNTVGQLGDPRAEFLTRVDWDHRVKVALPSAVALAAGDAHTCAVAQEGGIFCWGDADALPASRVPRFDERWVMMRSALASGGNWGRSCVLGETGAVYCRPFGGVYTYLMAKVDGLGPAAEIGGDEVSGMCARLRSGEVTCWRLGPPRLVAGVRDAVALVAEAPCAKLRDGMLACWERAYVGDHLVGHAMPELGVVQSAIGTGAGNNDSYGACALTARGEVRCWGFVGFRWSTEDHPAMTGKTWDVTSAKPRLIPGGTGIAEIGPGCARRSDGIFATLAKDCRGADCPLRIEPGLPRTKVARLVPGTCLAERVGDGAIVAFGQQEWIMGPHVTKPASVVVLPPDRARETADGQGCVLAADGIVRCPSPSTGALDVVVAQERASGVGSDWNDRCALLAAGGVRCRRFDYDKTVGPAYDPFARGTLAPVRCFP